MTRTFIAIAVTLATLSSAQAQQTIEADNGAVYRIIQTRHYDDGTAQTAVSTPDVDTIGLIFDCRGHMATQSSGMHSIAPHSVAGRISQIACAGPKER
jgi:hypothetical protein